MRFLSFSLVISLILLFLVLNVEAQEQHKGQEQGQAQDQTHSHPALEIFITADPLRPGIAEYGSPVSVLDREAVLLRGKSSLGETLSNEPGLSSTYFGPGASRPVIRGNAGERIRILQNGIGTFDLSNISEDHAVTIDPYSFEQVEILRGPETLFYGSNAIGGLVNVDDASIPEKPVAVPMTGDLDYRMGTVDDEISGGAKLQGELGKLNWNLSGFARRTHDLDIPGFAESEQLRAAEAAEGEAEEEEGEKGTLPNTATRTKGATVGASYVWDKGFVGAAVSTFRSRYGVPGHAHENEDEGEHEEELHEDDILGLSDDHSNEAGTTGVAIDAEQVRLDLRGEVREVSDFIERIRFRSGVANYDHKELEGSEVGAKLENDAGEARLEVVHSEQAGFRGALGLQLQASDFNAEGEEAFVPPNQTFSPAAFLFEEYQLNDHWKLQAGGRSEYVEIDPEGSTTANFLPYGLSTGVVFDPTGESDYTIGLSLAYTQRAPSATELFGDGVHLARQIAEVGDANLENERSWGADLTFKKNFGVVTGAFSPFYQHYKDYINLSATGEELDEFPVFAYESVRARFWGFEAESTFHLHQLLDWYHHEVDFGGQVDFVRAKNLRDDEDLPRIPPLRTRVQASYHYKTLWGAHLEGIFVENQDNLAPTELPTEAYQLVNASVEYSFPLQTSAKLSLFAQGNNLTDEEARVHASFLKDLAPLPGRAFLFGVRGTF